MNTDSSKWNIIFVNAGAGRGWARLERRRPDSLLLLIVRISRNFVLGSPSKPGMPFPCWPEITAAFVGGHSFCPRGIFCLAWMALRSFMVALAAGEVQWCPKELLSRQWLGMNGVLPKKNKGIYIYGKAPRNETIKAVICTPAIWEDRWTKAKGRSSAMVWTVVGGSNARKKGKCCSSLAR